MNSFATVVLPAPGGPERRMIRPRVVGGVRCCPAPRRDDVVVARCEGGACCEDSSCPGLGLWEDIALRKQPGCASTAGRLEIP